MRPAFQIRNRTLLLFDLLLIVTSVLASFALRLDLGPLFAYYLRSAWIMIAVALIVKPLVYYFFGLYRRYWIYASVRELRLVFFCHHDGFRNRRVVHHPHRQSWGSP